RSLTRRPPPRPTLFPYTTLFRSLLRVEERAPLLVQEPGLDPEVPAPGVGDDLGHVAMALARVEEDLDGGERARSPPVAGLGEQRDRKSTRLNSSHVSISYAVFCL